MRTLSKSEMKAVSGGIDCGAYQPYNSYSCSPYPVVNPPVTPPVVTPPPSNCGWYTIYGSTTYICR